MEAEIILCQSCKANIFNETTFGELFVDVSAEDYLKPIAGGLRIHKSIEELTVAAASGCEFCRALQGAIEPRKNSGLGDNAALKLHLYFSTPTARPLHDVSRLVVDMESYGFANFSIFADEADPSASFLSVREPDPVVDSEATFALARSWIHECLHQHEACLSPVSNLPSRVLDVAPNEPDVELRLVESQGSVGKYATLSYCWGGSGQPMRATSQNRAQYLELIDGTMLPRTIQDAIRVTRALNIRYLWVDSLCILQDSVGEKNLEISQMGRIFQNAQICILAAAAETAEDGFLARSEPSTPAAFRLPYFWKNKRQGSFTMRPQTTAGDYDGSQDPVSQRGWIFQERILSQRQLIFPPAPYPLQWRCRSQQRTNGGSSIAHFVTAIPSLPPDRHALDWIAKVIPMAAEDRDGYGRWWLWTQLVRDLTSRCFSESLDRLPAMSAVAAEFQQTWGGEYLAGLWTHAAIQSLLWFFYPGAVPVSPQSVEYSAPSWSWASCNQEVAFALSRDNAAIHTLHFDILKLAVTPLDAHLPLGLVTGGTLEVRALIKPAYCVEPVRWTSVLADSEDHSLRIGQLIADVMHPSFRGIVWCVPIIDARRYEVSRPIGILLTKLGEQRFRRVGALKLSALDWFDDCEPTVFEIV